MEHVFGLSDNKIGAAIQYFRESYGITQGKLCKGLCSIATLSRIEAGERDADSLLLETLLERLGRMPNQFELILTDFDYLIYVNREEITNQIKERNLDKAEELLLEYEHVAASKGNAHMQFIIYSKALMNELQGGEVDETLNLLMDAISCTVPEFKAHRIKDYYLSNNEIGIIIDIIQYMLLGGLIDWAKEILGQIIEYLELQALSEENNLIYAKVTVLAGRLYLQEGHALKAKEMCDKGIERSKGSRKMDYLGDLYYLKAKTIEELFDKNVSMDTRREECVKNYIRAYHIYNICEERSSSDMIKNYLQEEYQWADID